MVISTLTHSQWEPLVSEGTAHQGKLCVSCLRENQKRRKQNYPPFYALGSSTKYSYIMRLKRGFKPTFQGLLLLNDHSQGKLIALLDVTLIQGERKSGLT